MAAAVNFNELLQFNFTEKQMRLEPEFLLKLTDKSCLDLVEVLQLTERNEDDDGFAATVKLELLRGRDVQIMEISLQLSGRDLNN